MRPVGAVEALEALRGQYALGAVGALHTCVLLKHHALGGAEGKAFHAAGGAGLYAVEAHADGKGILLALGEGQRLAEGELVGLALGEGEARGREGFDDVACAVEQTDGAARKGASLLGYGDDAAHGSL